MKKLLGILLLFFFASCAHMLQRGSSLQLGGSAPPKPIANIRFAKNSNALDSLRIRYQGDDFTIAIPYKKVFTIICRTPEDVILKSADGQILVFIIRTKTWSPLKKAPEKDCT